MGLKIEDGTGKGNVVGVNSNNQLLVSNVSRDVIVEESEVGNAFNLPSNFITVTGSSGIVYVKNSNSTTDFHLWTICLTNASTLTKWTIQRNPTTGSLIVDNESGTPQNIDFGSSKTFLGVFNTGSSGKTVTDGGHFMQIESNGFVALSLDGALVLEPGSSISLVANPASPVDVSVTLTGYYDSLET